MDGAKYAADTLESVLYKVGVGFNRPQRLVGRTAFSTTRSTLVRGCGLWRNENPSVSKRKSCKYKHEGFRGKGFLRNE